MRNRFLSALLAPCMVLTLLPASVLAAEPENSAPAIESTIMPIASWSSTDWLAPKVKTWENQLTDAADAWCAGAIRTVYEAGLMEGKTADKFDISAPLTYAQVTVITARFHELLNGGDGVFPAPAEGEEWYHPARDYLLGAERTRDTADLLLDNMSQWGSDQTLPNQPCTREDFALMLLSILPEEPERPLLNPTAFAPDLTADSPIHALYQAGILMGSDNYGAFHPHASLTRGAAAAILARAVDPVQRQRFELLTLDVCRDILGVEPDTVLLTMNGEEITAEIFAYACVESGYLQNVGNAPFLSGDLIKDGVLSFLHGYGAYALLSEELNAAEEPAGEGDTDASTEGEQELLAKAREKAGTGGISEEGWYWILRHLGMEFDVWLYYESHYESGGPHYANSAVTLRSNALSAAKERIAVETNPALDAIDWGGVYMRALETPCASSYSLYPW